MTTTKTQHELTIFLELSDDVIGTPSEREEIFYFLEKLIGIVESRNLGFCDELTTHHGSAFIRFQCMDADSVANTIMDKIKEFNPSQGSKLCKIYTTTEKTSEKIML